MVAQQIKVEVTERGFIDVHKITPVTQAFRRAGYEVTFDDLGAECSDLRNLSAPNVDILKIDESPTSMLSTNSTSYLIAKRIIETAQSLHLKTIVEGVEMKEQVGQLFKRGVQHYQSWYFAKALLPQKFTHWIQRSLAILAQGRQQPYRR